MATSTQLTYNTSSYGTMGYRPDPDDPTKLIPNVRQNDMVPHVTAPASGTMAIPRPDHVLIVSGGNYLFHFDQNNQTEAGKVDFGHISGSDLHNAAGVANGLAGPTRLDISPIDWDIRGKSGTLFPTGSAGDVLFVYKGAH